MNSYFRTNNTSFRRIIVFLLMITFLFACSFPSFAYEQTRSEQTNIMYYIDITNDGPTGWHWNDTNSDGINDGICGDGMSDYVALKMIQGIVNQDAPRLYMNQGLLYYTDTDIKWKEILEGKGYRFVKLNNLMEVIQTFKQYFNGTVTYNHTLTTDYYHWPEADMAAVVGWLSNRIPIQSSRQTYFQNTFGLYAATNITLYDTFSDYYDEPATISGHLENYTWSTPKDAYEWGKNNLLKFCNPHEFHLMCEESMDLAAERKMFYTYLRSNYNTGTEQNPVYPEFNLLGNIYEYYDTRNDTFPVWGWGGQEDRDLHQMAAYGGILQCCGSTNVSFMNKLPSENLSFKHSTEYTTANTTVDTTKYYVTFLAAENDAIRTVTALQHGAWLDSNRGNFPISWGFEAWLGEQLPFVANYFYSTATTNDYFFSGGTTPLGFADYDDLPAAAQNEVKQLSAYHMQNTNQKYIDLYSKYGEIGAFDSVEFADLGNKAGIDGVTLDEDGFSGDFQSWGNTIAIPRETYQYRDDALETLRGHPNVVEDFKDSFANASSWTPEGGSWSVASGEYIQTGTTRTISKANVYPTMAYLNYEASVKQTGTTNGAVGIAFRAGTGNNYYWFYLRDGNKAGLKKVVNGVETVIGSEIDFAYSADTYYNLKTVADGTSIKCYINSYKKVADVSDSTFTSGKIGFACNSNARFDNAALVVTTQVQQVINHIMDHTKNVGKAKPYFFCGLYTDFFDINHEKVQWGSEPRLGMNLSMGPTLLKEVVDYFNTNYPGEFKFVRYDEWVSAIRKHNNLYNNSDTVSPVATAVDGLGTSIPLSTISDAAISVRVTENTNISTSAVTLKWRVQGKPGTGSASLTGRATKGTNMAFVNNSVNLNTGITNGVDVGDAVHFWVEGADAAGNSFFTVNNSSSDPLASIQIAKNKIDDEKWSSWTVTNGSMISVDTATKKNGSTSLKAVFPNASWHFASKTGGWNATGYDGIGMWIKGTIGMAYVKCSDNDGTTFQSAVNITPNQWSYVYIPFTANVSGGDGVFNTSFVSSISLMYDPVLGGAGATYYYDDIEFVKDRSIQVDRDRYRDWIVTDAATSTSVGTTNAGLGNGYALKGVFGGSTPDWQRITYKGSWNAFNNTGIGMWVFTGNSYTYLRAFDADGTYCQQQIAVTPNVWNYVYMPFTSNASGGDGVFNADSIHGIEIMYNRAYGDGSSYYAYYYDNIEFVKEKTSEIDSEAYTNWAGSTYNLEKTAADKKNGTYSLKVAYHNEGPQWQSVLLGGRWNASSYSKLSFWVKAPLANVYAKVYDSDGTSCQGYTTQTPTVNTWTSVSVPLTSNISGGDGTFNKDRIAKVELMYYNSWGSGSNDYIYYYDDISFSN